MIAIIKKIASVNDRMQHNFLKLKKLMLKISSKRPKVTVFKIQTTISFLQFAPSNQKRTKPTLGKFTSKSAPLVRETELGARKKEKASLKACRLQSYTSVLTVKSTHSTT